MDWRCCCCCCCFGSLGRCESFRIARLESIVLFLSVFFLLVFVVMLWEKLRLRLEVNALVIVSGVVRSIVDEEICATVRLRCLVPVLSPMLFPVKIPAAIIVCVDARSMMGSCCFLPLLFSSPLDLDDFAVAFLNFRFPGIPQIEHWVAESSSLSYVQ